MSPAASSPALLAVHQLGCRRGGRRLFRALSFALGPGQLLWLQGANGRGKTSLLRLLAGLSAPEQGRVHRPAAALYVGHANALSPDLTALESLQFLAQLQGQRAAAADGLDALGRAGLQAQARVPVRRLSQGQRRRVALARLFLRPSRPLWLLDEPFDALDAEAAALLCDTLRAHAEAGGAAVLASHAHAGLQGLQPTRLSLDEPALA